MSNSQHQNKPTRTYELTVKLFGFSLCSTAYCFICLQWQVAWEFQLVISDLFLLRRHVLQQLRIDHDLFFYVSHLLGKLQQHKSSAIATSTSFLL